MQEQKILSLEYLHVSRAVYYCEVGFVWSHARVHNQDIKLFFDAMTEGKHITARVELNIEHAFLVLNLGHLI